MAANTIKCSFFSRNVLKLSHDYGHIALRKHYAEHGMHPLKM
jgi:hypothetical protein